MNDSTEENRHWGRSILSGLMASLLLQLSLIASRYRRQTRYSGHYEPLTTVPEFLGSLLLGACFGLLSNLLKIEKNPVLMVLLGAVIGFLGSFWLRDPFTVFGWVGEGAFIGGLCYGEANNKLGNSNRFKF